MMNNISTRSWVSCQLGINHLLSLVNKGNKADAEKYYQIGIQLQKKSECFFKSKLFAKSSEKIGDTLISDVEINENPLNALSQWAAKLMVTNNIKLNVPKSEFILANISAFKGTWKTSTDGALMKVYNSFNYTQNVKYEARLLEVPLKEDFKFIIIVPNESDVLQNLFQKLTNKGLESALKSIQPLFVAWSEINAPKIRFQSEHLIKGGTTKNINLSQYGCIDANDKGLHIEVLSCFNSACSEKISETLLDSALPFYFGLMHEDMAVFIGQYISPDNNN